MRWTRLVAVTAVAAVLAVSFAGWRMLSSARVATALPASAAKLHGALEQQLQLLAGRLPVPRPVQVLPARPVIPYGGPDIPYGGVCYVGPGRCSLTPCTEFARAGRTEVAGTSSGVVLRLGGPLSRGAAPRPGRSACEGRVGTPRVLRVSGP